MIANTMLVRWLGGQVEIKDTASITAYGRREAPLQAGDLGDMDAVQQVATSNLGVTKDPVTSITAIMDEVDAASGYAAYVDYGLGDTVTWPTIAGGSAAVRCASITVIEDEHGYLDVTPEFITARDVLEQRVKRWLTRTNDGALAGVSATAATTSVSSASILGSTVVNPANVSFSSNGDTVLATGDESGPGKTPDIEGFLYRVEFTCNTAGVSGTIVDLEVNGAVIATMTIAASNVLKNYDLTSSETLIVAPGDIIRLIVDTAGGHAGVTARCLIASVEI